MQGDGYHNRNPKYWPDYGPHPTHQNKVELAKMEAELIKLQVSLILDSQLQLHAAVSSPLTATVSSPRFWRWCTELSDRDVAGAGEHRPVSRAVR